MSAPVPPKLQVLVVEDSQPDMEQLLRDLPEVFEEEKQPAKLHPCYLFEKAFDLFEDPSIRYDMVISDTYRGDTGKGDAQGKEIVSKFRDGKFCPLLMISSGVKPPEIKESPFLIWADKARPEQLRNGVKHLLGTQVPRLARMLRDQLDNSAGSYLWEFLDNHWPKLHESGATTPDVLERIMRRRAATKLGDINPDKPLNEEVPFRDASEFYFYPPLESRSFSLGDILRHKKNKSDIRVLLTPHCHLHVQDGQQTPRAEFVLTVKTALAKSVLGQEKISNANEADLANKHKKIGLWSRSPAETGKRPEGRHWFLPAFLEIPHSYCDFLLMESIAHGKLQSDYEVLATLVTPFAEALQSCFVGFYGSVGIASVRPGSISSLFD